MIRITNRGILWFLGFGLWLGETAYFGWNATPQSYAEAWLDKFCLVLMLGALWPGKHIVLTIVKRRSE